MNRSTPIEVKIQNWRIDDDGMLRVTANIIREGIFPYRPDGKKDYPEELAHKEKVLEFIPRDQFTEESLATLEGKPVVADEHEWQDAFREDESDEAIEARKIGSIAGKPIATDDGFIRADLLITDPEAIRRIRDKELVEVSAGYHSSVDFSAGEFDGERYDGKQTSIRFNHVAILPKGAGRCGPDVKIINEKEGESMSIKIQRKVGNSQREYVFENENDAKAAERMADEAREAGEETIRELTGRVNAFEAEVAEKAKENEGLVTEKNDLGSQIAELKAMVAKLLHLEEKEQIGDEEAIIAEELNSDDSKEADEAKKDVEKANSLDERRSAIVKRVARLNGIDAEKWDQKQIDANFSLLAVKARKAVEKRKNAARSSSVDGERNNSASGKRPGVRERIAARQAEKK